MCVCVLSNSPQETKDNLIRADSVSHTEYVDLYTCFYRDQRKNITYAANGFIQNANQSSSNFILVLLSKISDYHQKSQTTKHLFRLFETQFKLNLYKTTTYS